ncbi:conserved exported hypothetical protein [Candidatus Desulfarcum epimagneticum]|uniref:CHAT domain-containing protein n=1 Tax=uncultured Desulfobacteraceae bacterium TaxID=218296 RepID=A0A484HFU5_9BACT|nr:conserved exported hypothetical protein [uncultured Desulfobacteraceae bacterium]
MRMGKKTLKIRAAALWVLLAFVMTASSAWARSYEKPGETPREWMETADALYETGDFERAGDLFEASLEALRREIEPHDYLRAVMRLSQCHKALGRHKRALSVFEEALPVLHVSADRYLNVIFLSAFADLHFTLGKIEETVKWLTVALEEARLSENRVLLAAVFNDLGNGLSWSDDFEPALEAYDRCLEFADSEKSPRARDLRIRAMINRARALHLKGEGKKAFGAARAIWPEIEKTPDGYRKAWNAMACYELLDELRGAGSRPAGERGDILFSLSKTALEKGLEIASETGSQRLVSLFNGSLGKLYERERGGVEKAVDRTEKAIFFAGRAGAPELLYRWQWQMARLFEARKDAKGAMTYYRRAIETLNPIRSSMFSGYRRKKDLFNAKVKPVYLGLARLLLEQARGAASGDEARREGMIEARDVMEILKTAELQDFFKDECSAVMERDPSDMRQTPEKTALLYPISLKDKLITLATFPDGMRQKSVRVTQDQVKKATLGLRTGLQNRTKKTFIYDARKLYDWLIRPFEAELEAQGVDTLVIAPDGVLRLVPFSTLHDGARYLTEKYAIGTIPGIALTDFGEFNMPEKPEILVTGLSDAVQGFSALPNITAELRDIREIMGATSFYFNQGHNFENLTREFENKDHVIVHMATHGVFGDSAENTFLLLYENKLNLNDLSGLISMGKYRGKPVELLTLSACQTALGDERAALGLAGAAVKAGVKSVIATLWFVDDEATSILIRDFYRRLKTPGMTKSRALQQAQTHLLSKKRYRHPAYWAPFLLIGNWM